VAPTGHLHGLIAGDLTKTPFSHPSRWIRGKKLPWTNFRDVSQPNLDSRMSGRLQCLPWLIQDLPHYDTNGHRIAASAYFYAGEGMLFW